MLSAMRSLPKPAWAFLALALVYLPAGRAQQPSQPAPDLLSELRWRYTGPAGNRVASGATFPGSLVVLGVVRCEVFNDQVLAAATRRR